VLAEKAQRIAAGLPSRRPVEQVLARIGQGDRGVRRAQRLAGIADQVGPRALQEPVEVDLPPGPDRRGVGDS
jgi:hypothetical protein